jgi:hypothetical protein
MITSSPGSMKPMKALSMPINHVSAKLRGIRLCDPPLTFICAGCDRDLGFGVQLLAKEGRICVRDRLSKAGAALRVVSGDLHACAGYQSFLPWWESIGCIPLGPAHPLQRQWRTWEGYNHCPIPSQRLSQLRALRGGCSDSQEPLAHVHDGLNGRSCGSLIDD